MEEEKNPPADKFLTDQLQEILNLRCMMEIVLKAMAVRLNQRSLDAVSGLSDIFSQASRAELDSTIEDLKFSATFAQVSAELLEAMRNMERYPQISSRYLTHIPEDFKEQCRQQILKWKPPPP